MSLFERRLYEAVSGAERLKPDEATNGTTHFISLTLSKFGDGVIDPKLTLAWLLTALGAPAAVVGALVPIREAGSLLPQLSLAPFVQSSPLRKWFWVAGAAVQGVAALGVALSAMLLEGVSAGVAILALITVFALARSSCSISYKDALAQTIPKSRRGAVTGAAGSVAAALVLGFGIALAFGVIPLTVSAIAIAIGCAGGLWIVSALLFATLGEPRDDDAEDMAPRIKDLFAPLSDDRQLRIFLATRALLIPTALAPPFVIMISATESGGLGDLGPLVIASALASIFSSYAWGRLSDQSSRRTLIAAGAMASIVLFAIGAVGLAFGELSGIASVMAIFCAQIAYEGARAGRKLHLTDMTSSHTRARYTALSNTLIGGALIVGGAFGVVADWFGPAVTLVLMGLFCAVGALVASGLHEVQSDGE